MKSAGKLAALWLCMILMLAFLLPAAPLAAEAAEPPEAPQKDNATSDKYLSRLGQQNKLVALTFDDGPGPFTAQLLDELEERGAKATFFLFASKITEDTSPLVKRMVEEGHCVGSHTYNHARLTTLSDYQIQKELQKADEAICNVTGFVPQLVRPPFGAYSDRVINASGKPMILWSLDTRDWQLHDSQSVCKNILDAVKDGDIVLLHELELSSKDGVIAAIDIMLDEGYSFVTVPELFRLRGIPLEAGKHYHDACTINSNHDSGLEMSKTPCQKQGNSRFQ